MYVHRLPEENIHHLIFSLKQCRENSIYQNNDLIKKNVNSNKGPYGAHLSPEEDLST